MNKAATIRDVARACGRSHMTVSNVLNNRDSVSETTRAVVLEAMKRLNFQPNAIARGLNRKPMNTIGIVLPNAYEAPTAHPYYSLLLDGIMGAAVALGTDVITYTGSLWSEGTEGLQPYRDGRSDGLLVISPAVDSSLVSYLIESQCAFVCIGDHYAEPEVSCVCIDDVHSQTVLVEHLISLGHRRIAMFDGENKVRCVGLRRDGYRNALLKHGIPIDESLILAGGFEESTIFPRLERIAGMDRSLRPTAICTTNDQMALVVLSGLATLGIQVPAEISVVGFDDVRGAAAGNLTTMRQPIRAIGYRAAELLTKLISDEGSPVCKQFFPTELIVRGSTASPQNME